MFQYTREIVINLQKFEAQVDKNNSEITNLFVDHVGTYRPEYVKGIIKVDSIAESLEKAEITVPTPIKGASYRLDLRVLLKGDVEASYANSFTYFNKPFYVEVIADDTTAANLATKLATAATKAMSHTSEHKFVKVTAAGAKIEVEASDCYQRIHTMEVEQFVPRSGSQGTLEWEGTWQAVGTGFAIKVKGTQGHGNYFQILKNNRLPTIDQLRFAGQNQEENPIPGSKYTMFELTMSADRNIGGAGVVGEKGKSITTHRFWVTDTRATEFENVLKAAFPTLYPSLPAGAEVKTSRSAR